MAQSDIKAKYEILTDDVMTWKKCEATYPLSVKQKWVERIVADLVTIKKPYSDVKRCCEIVNDCRNKLKVNDPLVRDIPYSARAAYYASGAFIVSSLSNECEDKWNLYISWLIEELIAYEALLDCNGIPLNLQKGH